MPKLTKRSFMLGALATPFAADAQSWPPATVKIVVPYPPAGSTDVMARLVQPELQRRLGTTIIIENRPGASGAIGTAAVARSAPDGSNWLMVFDNHGANPYVMPNLPYDTEKDLDPVLLVGTAPYVLSTHPGKPFKTIDDVIAAARAKPDTIGYASVGSGSIGHLAMVMLSKAAGLRLVHIPYRGGGPAMNDTVAGHVDLLIGSTALSVPQIQAGAIKAVMQTGKVRTPALADVPTGGEGGFPGFEAYAWWGVFAPAGTPKPIVDRFNTEFSACLREDRVAKQLTETQQISLVLGGPQELRKFLAEQMQQWGPLAREHNIKAD